MIQPRRLQGVLCLLLVLTVGRPVASAPPEKELPTNFAQVTPWLYRGGQPSSAELRTLAEMGIATIVDLRRGERTRKQRLARELGMSYVAIPMSARKGVQADDLERFLAVLDDPGRQPVYVHCREGRHRTGIMVALYRVLRERMSAEDAYAEMQRHHFDGDYPNLRDYLFERAEAVESVPGGGGDTSLTAAETP